MRARTQHQASLDVFAARGGQLPRRPPNPVVTEVKPGDRIEGNGWRATVGESSHMQPFLQCYGYRIDSDAGSLCYAGDSGGVCETVIALARKADILIHMMHLASGTEPSAQFRQSSGAHTDVAEVARRAEVGALVLTHFTPHIDTPGTRERLISEMSTIYGGPIIWGEDLMTLSVPHVSHLRHRLGRAVAHAARRTTVGEMSTADKSTRPGASAVRPPGGAATARADRHRGGVAGRLRDRSSTLLSQHARRGVRADRDAGSRTARCGRTLARRSPRPCSGSSSRPPWRSRSR